jgi:signal transduction histidine kinase
MDSKDPELIPKDIVRHFAHEAAAPLMIVTMLSEMLLDAGNLGPAEQEDVRKIQRAGKELAELIRALRTP